MRTGPGQLLHFILKRDSRVFYKKNYYTGKQGYPDCNRNPESYRIPLRVFVEYVLRHNEVSFYSINTVKVSPTFNQIQTLRPYFGQHTVLIGKQMITIDQGTDDQLAVSSKPLAARIGFRYSVISIRYPVSQCLNNVDLFITCFISIKTIILMMIYC